jgi:hypothetical protein
MHSKFEYEAHFLKKYTLNYLGGTILLQFLILRYASAQRMKTTALNDLLLPQVDKSQSVISKAGEQQLTVSRQIE